MNPQKNHKVSILIVVASLLSLSWGCGTSTKESNSLGGTGGGTATCTVNDNFHRIEDITVNGRTKARYEFAPGQTEPLADMGTDDPKVFDFVHGSCHAEGVDCKNLTPQCASCDVVTRDDGVEVIRLTYGDSYPARCGDIKGNLIVVLDDGGGGGGDN